MRTFMAQLSCTTSEPFIVPSARQVASAMSLAKNCIEQSAMITFTPPGCRLRAALCELAEPTAVYGGFSGFAPPAGWNGATSVPLLGVLIVMYIVHGVS